MLVDLEKVFPEVAKVHDLKGLFVETMEITTHWIDREKEPNEIHIETTQEHYIIPRLDSGFIDLTNIIINDAYRAAILSKRNDMNPRDFRRHMKSLSDLEQYARLRFC